MSAVDKKSFRCIDLFAGIGGFRIAMERCGGECAGFSEINSDAINAYVANHPQSDGTNFGDITKLKDLPQHDLMTGGVPCQSWSIAGRNLGFDDDRGQLWNDALYLLNKSRPKAFMFENVKGLVDPRNKAALDYIMTRIRDAGYFANYHVINSFDYGVPQSRVRIYIIGFREKKYFDKFALPSKPTEKIRLKDILDETVVEAAHPAGCTTAKEHGKRGATSLSANNNGFNDYFLFNDLRNGQTTIHSWDILDTTEKQKHICLLLLKNRRKDDYGALDGNPLSLAHFQALDSSITQRDIDALCELDILRPEVYRYKVLRTPHMLELDDNESFVLTLAKDGELVPDVIGRDMELRKRKINAPHLLAALAEKGVVKPVETRYDFRFTKISTGLFGINRIFLPSSNIFPTLVASDSSDYVTPIQVEATNEEDYRSQFLEQVYVAKRFRRISKVEACRIQGFPDDFKLPENRARWMKLIGNSVSVPVVEKLVAAICATGVFAEATPQSRGVVSYSPRPQQLRLAIERRKGYRGAGTAKSGADKKGVVKTNAVAKAKRPKSVKSRYVKHGGKKLISIILAMCVASATATSAFAADARYFAADEMPDMVKCLPPPPAPDSAEFAADVAGYRLGKERRKDPETARRVLRDAEWTVEALCAAFDEAFGAKVRKGAMPATWKVVENAILTTDAMRTAPKKHYARKRPFVHFGEPPMSPDDAQWSDEGSYPSGHTMRSWLAALILAEINPARADAIYARAWEFGEERVVAGAHWQSDVDATRPLASIAYSRLQTSPAFRADMEKAKLEFTSLIRRDNH